MRARWGVVDRWSVEAALSDVMRAVVEPTAQLGLSDTFRPDPDELVGSELSSMTWQRKFS